MASWVQPYDDAARRVTVPYITAVENRWQVDTVWVHFEGRAQPVAARGTRETDEWTVAAEWAHDERSDAAAYIDLLRSVALESDTRLEVHLEPHNGAVVDAVAQCVDVPRDADAGGETIAVTFRRVDDTA